MENPAFWWYFARKAWGFSMAPWDPVPLTIHFFGSAFSSIPIAGARAMRQDENFRECPSCQAGNGYSGGVRKQYGWKSRICTYFVRCKGLIQPVISMLFVLGGVEWNLQKFGMQVSFNMPRWFGIPSLAFDSLRLEILLRTLSPLSVEPEVQYCFFSF